MREKKSDGKEYNYISEIINALHELLETRYTSNVILTIAIKWEKRNVMYITDRRDISFSSEFYRAGFELLILYNAMV